MFLKININIISLILIWFSVFTILTHARNATRKDCDHVTEEYKKCGVLAYCETSCNFPVARGCLPGCVAGCFCVEPYMRKCINSPSCILEDDCGHDKGPKCRDE